MAGYYMIRVNGRLVGKYRGTLDGAKDAAGMVASGLASGHTWGENVEYIAITEVDRDGNELGTVYTTEHVGPIEEVAEGDEE